MMESFSYNLQTGRIDVGFLGGTQVNKHGKINSTVISDYDGPMVRLLGSGGACEIAANVDRTIIIAPY